MQIPCICLLSRSQRRALFFEKEKDMKKLRLFILLLLLVTLVSCNKQIEAPEVQEGNKDNIVETVDPLWEDAFFNEDTTFGEGEKNIKVEVKAGEKSITFTVNTDADTLADALIEYNLIEGEDSAYGIYIKKVNGILADYDVDKHYWSLLKNGEYLMTGADSTVIADGEHYELVRTK